jgi:hypothetical protein
LGVAVARFGREPQPFERSLFVPFSIVTTHQHRGQTVGGIEVPGRGGNAIPAARRIEIRGRTPALGITFGKLKARIGIAVFGGLGESEQRLWGFFAQGRGLKLRSVTAYVLRS